MQRVSNMPPEECFTRTLFGVIMVFAAFVKSNSKSGAKSKSAALIIDFA